MGNCVNKYIVEDEWETVCVNKYIVEDEWESVCVNKYIVEDEWETVCVNKYIVGDEWEIAKLRRTYPCGNVKSNCNFVFHNGERKEIT